MYCAYMSMGPRSNDHELEGSNIIITIRIHSNLNSDKKNKTNGMHLYMFLYIFRHAVLVSIICVLITKTNTIGAIR